MQELSDHPAMPASAGRLETLRAVPWAAYAARLRRHPLAQALAIPSLLVLAALAFRAMAFGPAVIDTDEGLYILQAREWLRGGWPYLAVWDMHPVGAPGMFAAALAIFGKSIETIRLLGALCCATTAWFLYRSVRLVDGPRWVGLGAGMLFLAFTATLGGLASNTEILFNPFVAGALFLGLRGMTGALGRAEAPSWRDLVLMGLLVGWALTIKPVVVPQGGLAFLMLVGPALWRRLLGWRQALAMAALYALCCAAPTLLIALGYVAKGAFGAFLYGSFLAPLSYAQNPVSFAMAWERISEALVQLLLPLALAACALPALRRRDGQARQALLVCFGLAWLAAAVVSIAGPGMYFNHYFQIALAPLSLLAAIGTWRLAWRLRPGLALPAFVGLVGAVAFHGWLTGSMPRLERGLDAPDPPRQVAQFIRQQIRPGEPIFVANYHTAVYVLARAGVPTPYAFPAHLTCAFDKVTGIDADAEVKRVLSSRPRFIVVDRGWWNSMRRRVRGMLTRTLDRHYVLVHQVQEERGPVEIWRRI